MLIVSASNSLQVYLDHDPCGRLNISGERCPFRVRKSVTRSYSQIATTPAMSGSGAPNSALGGETSSHTATNVRTEAGTASMATTVDRSDREAPAAIINKPSDIPRGLFESVTTHFAQDIKTFLGKPYLLGQGTIGLATTGLVDSWSFPSDIWANPLYVDKLKGFLGMRGTIEVRLQTNANKFQQCRLLMAWIPQGQVMGVNPAIRFVNLQTITQLPHVEMDVNCDSECTFELPYVSPTMFYNIVDGTGPWGVLYLYVYSPLLIGAGSNTFSYALWVRFLPESLDLLIPTYNTTVALQNRVFEAQMRRVQIKKKGSSKGSQAEEEADSAKSGPVSTMLNKASKFLASFGGVPMVSDFTGPASWVSAGLGGLASAFGYSKPRNSEKTSRMQTNIVHPWNANCDVMDNVWPLGLFSGNTLDPIQGFGGSSQEEMCFDYIVPKAAFYTVLGWDTTDAAGTTLQTLSMDPGSFRTSITGPPAYYTYAPWAFLASLFEYWRGDIRLTYKLVKTDWHQGRLVITFWPGVSPGTLAQSEYCHREIIDVSQGNEFSLVIPYVKNTLWSSFVTRTGWVTVHVLTELTCPDTVSTTVNILCEVSGMPGMQFAVPKPQVAIPFVQDPQNPLTLKKIRETVFSAQSGGTKTPANPCAIAQDQPLGGSSTSSRNLDAARYTVGEACISVLQLLKRYTAFTQWSPLGPLFQKIRPWTIAAQTYQSVGAVYLDNWFLGDYFSLFGMCYAYRRGGVRLRVQQSVVQSSNAGANVSVWAWVEGFPSEATEASMVSLDNAPVVIDTPSYETVKGDNLLGGNTVTFRTQEPLCVSVPMYHHSPYVLNRPSIDIELFCPNDIYENNTRLWVGGELAVGYWMRAVEEDFQFTYWLGVPPISIATPAAPDEPPAASLAEKVPPRFTSPVEKEIEVPIPKKEKKVTDVRFIPSNRIKV
jgi:hypothetical protein